MILGLVPSQTHNPLVSKQNYTQLNLQKKKLFYKSSKMVPGFSRSISLPLSPNHKANKKASRHVRSLSLPCCSHPLISHLEEQIRAVRSCASSPDQATSTSIRAILTQIETLQTSLENFLSLTQIQETLHGSETINIFLDNFLILADVYGSARSYNQLSQRRVEKEISQLTSTIKTTTKCRTQGLALNATEAEIIGILIEAISATSAASVTVFNGLVATSDSASTMKNASSLQLFKKLSTLNSTIKYRGSEEELIAMERFEEYFCIGNVEASCERENRADLVIFVAQSRNRIVAPL
ncbi:hypothetical protein LUZ60_007075 [Juncus effusus]|nr:hypothetical protein LUZ60_007075 [Juncus effusus]